MSLAYWLLPVVCVMLFSIAEAHAISDQYGIVLSSICIRMLSNNITTNCPSYEEIMVLFPDTTNQNALGEFQEIDGIIQRGKPNLLHPERYYDRSDGSVMWIDPPNEVRKRIKMIYLEPSLPPYKTGEESLIMNDYNVSFQRDRYITPNCGEAKITAENWVFLLGDTMNFLKHNCDPAFTNFYHLKSKFFGASYQDVATSNKYKLDQVIKLAKEKYRQSYIGSNEIVYNSSVTTDENER